MYHAKTHVYYLKAAGGFMLNVSAMGKRINPVLDAKQHVCTRRDKGNMESRFINVIKGYGVFASTLIEEGSFIVEYRGVLREADECIPDSYSFYFIYKNTRYCIDASKDDGSLGRLVNDDSNPNAKVKVISISRTPHLCLFALRDIEPGEEITYDYGGYDLPWRRGMVKKTYRNTDAAGITMDQRWPARVLVSASDVRKVMFSGRPDNIEALLFELKEKLALQYEFAVQYEDPEFNNALCNLSDPCELPDRPTLKILPLEMDVPTASSSSSSDIVIQPGTNEEFKLTVRDQWPGKFEIPQFSMDVEYKLKQGDLEYIQDGKRMPISRDMKHVILEKLAETMYQFMAYPQDEHFSIVASALIHKHPCLTEPGSVAGFYGWKNSLKFKMANFRTKLRRAGMAEVTINAHRKTKGNPDGAPPCKNLKRPRRREANFLPNFPKGQDAATLEAIRVALEDEMKKSLPDSAVVKQMMVQTYSLRRKEIVEEQPSVKRIMERWPALFTESQIFAEFRRLAAKDLEQHFFESVDSHTPGFIKIFKTKRGMVGRTLADFVCQVDTKTQDVSAMRTVVLRGLPALLGDDDSEFFRLCFDSDIKEDFIRVPVGILTTIPEDSPYPGPTQLHLDPCSIAIILEGDIILDNLQSYPEALCLLFGLMYVLHIEYPVGMKNTFQFVQKVMLELAQEKLSPRLMALKNMLLS